MLLENYQTNSQFLSETPDAIRHFVEGLTLEDLRLKPSEKEFSILEHICHLRDIEQEGYAVRIKRILAEENPLLEDIDGDKLAAERDYNNQDFASAFRDFTQARKDNVLLLNTVSAEQLERTGLFENVGAITLEELMAMMSEHDQDHRKGLQELREQALNKIN